MAILSIPTRNYSTSDPEEILEFFNARGLYFDQWQCDEVFEDTATQEDILQAYSKDLFPFMENGGYQSADVISINSLKRKTNLIIHYFFAEKSIQKF